MVWVFISFRGERVCGLRGEMACSASASFPKSPALLAPPNWPCRAAKRLATVPRALPSLQGLPRFHRIFLFPAPLRSFFSSFLFCGRRRQDRDIPCPLLSHRPLPWSRVGPSSLRNYRQCVELCWLLKLPIIQMVSFCMDPSAPFFFCSALFVWLHAALGCSWSDSERFITAT